MSFTEAAVDMAAALRATTVDAFAAPLEVIICGAMTDEIPAC